MDKPRTIRVFGIGGITGLLILLAVLVSSTTVSAQPLPDEPSGNLDPASASHLHELLARLARERRQTFVIATHNERLAASADRVLVLESGRLRPAAGVPGGAS